MLKLLRFFLFSSSSKKTTHKESTIIFLVLVWRWWLFLKESAFNKILIYMRKKLRWNERSIGLSFVLVNWIVQNNKKKLISLNSRMVFLLFFLSNIFYSTRISPSCYFPKIRSEYFLNKIKKDLFLFHVYYIPIIFRVPSVVLFHLKTLGQYSNVFSVSNNMKIK